MAPRISHEPTGARIRPDGLHATSRPSQEYPKSPCRLSSSFFSGGWYASHRRSPCPPLRAPATGTQLSPLSPLGGGIEPPPTGRRGLSSTPLTTFPTPPSTAGRAATVTATATAAPQHMGFRQDCQDGQRNGPPECKHCLGNHLRVVLELAAISVGPHFRHFLVTMLSALHRSLVNNA